MRRSRNASTPAAASRLDPGLAEHDHRRGIAGHGRSEPPVGDLQGPFGQPAPRTGPEPVILGSFIAAAYTGGSVADFGDQLDLHRRVQRQLGHADRAAGVLAVLAEHLDEQLAGAVDHLGLAAEAGRAGYEADDLDDPAVPSRPQATDAAAASALSAQVRAIPAASSVLTSAPTCRCRPAFPSTTGA